MVVGYLLCFWLCRCWSWFSDMSSISSGVSSANAWLYSRPRGSALMSGRRVCPLPCGRQVRGEVRRNWFPTCRSRAAPSQRVASACVAQLETTRLSAHEQPASLPTAIRKASPRRGSSKRLFFISFFASLCAFMSRLAPSDHPSRANWAHKSSRRGCSTLYRRLV